MKDRGEAIGAKFREKVADRSKGLSGDEKRREKRRRKK